MRYMTTAEIREKYLNYFQEKPPLRFARST